MKVIQSNAKEKQQTELSNKYTMKHMEGQKNICS